MKIEKDLILLRNKTGRCILSCKKALYQTKNIEEAENFLKKYTDSDLGILH